MRQPGFTLFECMIVLAVAAFLAGVALPGLQGRELRMGRLDAVASLTSLQVAQEQYRNLYGRYAADLATLRGVQPSSPQGRYGLSLHSSGPDEYQATASAIGVQQRDGACAEITLAVAHGFARQGPNAQCWGR